MLSWRQLDGLFDYERFYKWLAGEIPQNGKFIEIGVYRGRSACFLAELRPDVEFTLIDPFVDDNPYANFFNHERMTGDESIRRIKTLIARCVVIKSTSQLAASRLPREAYDAVFIDGDHEYGPVLTDLINYTPKVKKGGIVAGHDYFLDHPGVVKAVNEHFNKDRHVNLSMPDYSHVGNPVWWVRK
jgi:predicted O-methyltransferase YrrM